MVFMKAEPKCIKMHRDHRYIGGYFQSFRLWKAFFLPWANRRVRKENWRTRRIANEPFVPLEHHVDVRSRRDFISLFHFVNGFYIELFLFGVFGLNLWALLGIHTWGARSKKSFLLSNFSQKSKPNSRGFPPNPRKPLIWSHSWFRNPRFHFHPEQKREW